MSRSRLFLILLLAVQVFCAGLFLFNMLSSMPGFPFVVPWSVHEGIEIGAALGLVTGAFVSARAVRRANAESHKLKGQIRLASGAFQEVLEEHFEDWGLTPAERDVATFMMKGLAIPEIATMRGTSEGTVKAQLNAIYRKSGTSGRPQFLGLFIEELMNGAAAVPEAEGIKASA
ncbi:helix-turn-helix transcriptional regulator [Donghicola tyrosinivorans]|uniref:Regulatory LuxR family protein n=1 Tax=Donghicola tyrosinivorans TaxID=1652492 RepID=A0A2T0WG42_9RHOB|nr:LuxR C-terminal-related transcriptional regulator [Donghicola tyrosinivorans]PRY85642.1 regulatory LuxR family protein [Donghicola tyrosinivorans]